MWKHNFDESADTKARNRLSLYDRVQAIEAYEKTRNYTKVGLMFKCSAKQIRTIMNNKQRILIEYASKPTSNSKSKFNHLTEKRRAKKVALLGRVMYEWFLRARRNPSVCLISYNLIQKVALEVKSVLTVDNFYPNNAWLLNFREKYNIKDFDMKVQSNDTGPLDLDIKAIVDCVVEREKQEEVPSPTFFGGSECNDDSSASSTFHPTSTINPTTATRISGSENESESPLRCQTDSDDEPLSKYPKLQPIELIEIESDSEDDDDISHTRTPHSNSAIKTLDQALEHLKPLEEFALLKEDYRVIGLISQLETILKNSKSKS